METWYVLEDGGVADPREVVSDSGGRLRHKDGRAVAYAPHGPRSRSIDPARERAKASAGAAVRDMQPVAPKPAYRTRDMKRS